MFNISVSVEFSNQPYLVIGSISPSFAVLSKPLQSHGLWKSQTHPHVWESLGACISLAFPAPQTRCEIAHSLTARVKGRAIIGLVKSTEIGKYWE